MRKLLTGAALAAALLALPSQARAQASLGPILSWHDDFDLGIGMIVGVPLPGLDQNVEFLGDFSIFFPEPDGMDMWQINSGVTYVFPVANPSVMPFVLGGLSIARVSVDNAFVDASDSELGLNLGGGVKFRAGSLQPMVGLRAELDGADGVVIFGALPFRLGR